MHRSGVRSLSIATKAMAAIYAALVPLAIASTVLGLRAERGVRESMNAIAQSRDVKALADRSLLLIVEQESVTNAILVDEENIIEAPRKIEAFDSLRATLDKLSRESSNPELARVISEMTDLENRELRPLDSVILEVAGSGDLPRARTLFREKYRPVQERYAGLVHRLSEIADRDATATEAQAAQKNRRLFIAIGATLALGILAAGVAVSLVLKRVRRRLAVNLELLTAVTDGRLSDAGSDEGGDEIGVLANAAGQLNATIRGLMAEVTDLLVAAKSGRVADRGVSDQFRGVYRDLVHSMNEVVIGVAQTSAAIEEQHAIATSFVEETCGVLDRVAGGELHLRLEGSYDGLHQRARDALNQLIHSLADALAQVDHSTRLVAESGVEIDQASRLAAQEAAQQQTSVARVTEMLEQLRVSTRANAAAAGKAAQLAAATQRATQQGSEASTRVLEVLMRMKGSATSTADVAKTIDDIAARTNLLALNAQVEAARAGQAGRGFSVVAHEVKALATRSAAGARSTSQLVEQSVREAESGMAMRDELMASIRSMESQMGALAEVIAQVKEGSAQQEQAASEIDAAIGAVASSSRSSLSASENSAAAAAALSSEVGSLKLLVARIRGETSDVAMPPVRRLHSV